MPNSSKHKNVSCQPPPSAAFPKYFKTIQEILQTFRPGWCQIRASTKTSLSTTIISCIPKGLRMPTREPKDKKSRFFLLLENSPYSSEMYCCKEKDMYEYMIARLPLWLVTYWNCDANTMMYDQIIDSKSEIWYCIYLEVHFRNAQPRYGCWSITWLMHFSDDFGFNKNLLQEEKWIMETLTIKRFERKKTYHWGFKLF